MQWADCTMCGQRAVVLNVSSCQWVTDHAPDYADAHDSSGNCVEVTYENGLLGWEPLSEMRNWRAGQNGTQVVAWREIREAFKASE